MRQGRAAAQGAACTRGRPLHFGAAPPPAPGESAPPQRRRVRPRPPPQRSQRQASAPRRRESGPSVVPRPQWPLRPDASPRPSTGSTPRPASPRRIAPDPPTRSSVKGAVRGWRGAGGTGRGPDPADGRRLPVPQRLGLGQGRHQHIGRRTRRSPHATGGAGRPKSESGRFPHRRDPPGVRSPCHRLRVVV